MMAKQSYKMNAAVAMTLLTSFLLPHDANARSTFSKQLMRIRNPNSNKPKSNKWDAYGFFIESISNEER